MAGSFLLRVRGILGRVGVNIMARRLTWPEIIEEFDGEWVILSDFETEDVTRLRDAQVAFHHHDFSEARQFLRSRDRGSFLLGYAGEVDRFRFVNIHNA